MILCHINTIAKQMPIIFNVHCDNAILKNTRTVFTLVHPWPFCNVGYPWIPQTPLLDSLTGTGSMDLGALGNESMGTWVGRIRQAHHTDFWGCQNKATHTSVVLLNENWHNWLKSHVPIRFQKCAVGRRLPIERRELSPSRITLGSITVQIVAHIKLQIRRRRDRHSSGHLAQVRILAGQILGMEVATKTNQAHIHDNRRSSVAHAIQYSVNPCMSAENDARMLKRGPCSQVCIH